MEKKYGNMENKLVNYSKLQFTLVFCFVRDTSACYNETWLAANFQ